MIVVNIMLVILGIYLFLGFLFAIPFIIKGVAKIDEGAHGSGWGFRIIIIPGTMVFWPILLKKWTHADKMRKEIMRPAEE